MAAESKPLIAITMGDPCGIGPEVVVKALASRDIYALCRPVVIGNAWAMEKAAKLARTPFFVLGVDSVAGVGLNPNTLEVLDPGNLKPSEVTVGRVSATAGRAAMEWVVKAAELAMEGKIDAIATAPVNKAAARLGGWEEVGHMELLQRLSGAPEVATMLVSGLLRVVHLTTHRSLRDACDAVRKENILAKLELTHRSFQEWGFAQPRTGVAALNPHASDGGLLGSEEAEEIAPAVEEARQRGMEVSGPMPADIIFYQALQGQFDVVLAMYHDQGHIPIKVHGFERSISVNLGLPFVRTSVDHGTAFDIAGKGVANPQSMLEAIKLAASLSRGSGLEPSPPSP